MLNNVKRKKQIGKRIQAAMLVALMLVLAIIPTTVLADSSNGGGCES